MNKPKLVIGAFGIDTGSGQYQYRFTISPLVQGSPVFMTMLYCFNEDRDKKQIMHARKRIALELKQRHHSCWQRYHAWLENR